MTTTAPPAPFGERLRAWRQRRHLSQLELANRAEVSARHLSFLETGRSRPSREMVLHLTEVLDIPLRERNAIFIAAGFAPLYAERALDEPSMRPVRRALRAVLDGHEPYPALIVDRAWNLMDANTAATELFTVGVSPELLAPPINVVRVSLHPDGMASRIINFREYAAHFVTRLRRQVDLTADPTLAGLLEEIVELPDVETDPVPPQREAEVVLPLRITHEGVTLSLFTTIAVFGTPVDITLDELAIESFFPADDATAAYLTDHR